MGRIRSIHPGLFTDEAFVSLSPSARLLLIGIWGEADDAGVFEWKPVTLKMRLFPADNVDVLALLGELESVNCVQKFEHEGRHFGAVRNFGKYQKPKHPSYRHFIPDNFQHFCESQCFIQSAVPATFNDPPHTLDWVLDQATVAVKKDSVEVVMIDPWNELDRAKPRDMLLSDYIGDCLRLIKQFCRTFEVIVIVVAHPTKAVNENGGRVPNLSDIEGSMNWFNKCDNGVIVVREPNSNTSRVISAKVREIGAGSLGVCYFTVDPQTGVFTPQHGAVDEGP